MENPKKAIKIMNDGLCKEIDLAALVSRSQIAHKWKAPHRSIVLRELTHWRIVDLLNQIVLLAENKHLLGARILLRSTIETLAILIYLNKKTDEVLEGKEAFSVFSKTTHKLIVGSKNNTTGIEAINIVHTIIEKHCEKVYPGISEIYSDLSESAHPNYIGMCNGYSYVDKSKDKTVFKNRWYEKYANHIPIQASSLIEIFYHEYNVVWPELFSKLELWLKNNDELLQKKYESNGGI
jgi:hypothetical protein